MIKNLTKPTFILFLILFYTQLFAQMQKGKVTDSKTGAAIIGATVKVLDSNEGTITNEKGEFGITTNTPFQVSYVGYESQTVKPSGGYLRIQLVQNTLQLSEVVVSAYQKDTELLNVAAPVSVISLADLQRADNTTIIPIFNAVPGVKIDYYTVGDYRLNIRGGALAQPSVHSSGYRMYWNGIPITTASGSNPLGGLDINFIENIEIIKGPGSSLYGAGFGGTVLVNTTRATRLGTSLNTDFMVGDYSTLRSTSGVRHNDNWGNIALQYTRTQTDGYRDMTDSEGDVINLYGKLYTGTRGNLNFLYNYENRTANIAGDLDEETFLNAPTTANTVQPTGFGPNKHTLGIGYNYDFNTNWSAALGGYYFDNDGEFILSFPFFAIFDDEPSNGLNTRVTATYKNKLGNINLKVDGGFEYGYANNKATSYDGNFKTDTATVITINDAETDQLLAFTQAELELPNQLFFTAGLSYNRFIYDVRSGTNEANPLVYDQSVNQIVPRFSVLKRFGTYSIYASAGQGFNPPAAGIFNDFLNPDGTVNSDLQSSTGWNYEIGSRGGSRNGLFFYDLAVYNLNVQDAIISRLFEISPGVNAERKTNAGEVRQTGVETLAGINITTDPDDFWYGSQLRVGYTFNDFEYVDYQTFRSETDENFSTTFVPVDYSGQEIPGTIPHSFLVMADIRTKVGAYLNFTLNTYDETFLTDENDITLAGYEVMNLRIGYEANLLKDRLLLHPYLGANNLGNELYSGLTAYNSPFGGFYNPAFRRQWFGGLRVNYNF
ncbi:MAG: TonB-dependent receptor [Bacteroidota bacterium]